MGLHCRGVRIVADGSKLSAAKGKVEGKREEKRVYKPSFGVVRIPEERRSVDRPSTLPGLHCRFNAIHRRASGTPHGDSDGRIDLRKTRAPLPGTREREREKRRETRRESKWRARSFPSSPPPFPPSDRTNDLPPSTPLPNFQPTIPFSRFSSNETPDDFPPRLIRSKRERETKRKRKVGREGGRHNLAGINKGNEKARSYSRKEDRDRLPIP